MLPTSSKTKHQNRALFRFLQKNQLRCVRRDCVIHHVEALVSG